MKNFLKLIVINYSTQLTVELNFIKTIAITVTVSSVKIANEVRLYLPLTTRLKLFYQ